MHDHGHTFLLFPDPVLCDFDSMRQLVLMLNDAENQHYLLGFQTIFMKKYKYNP